jgi:hypothetical protein
MLETAMGKPMDSFALMPNLSRRGSPESDHSTIRGAGSAIRLVAREAPFVSWRGKRHSSALASFPIRQPLAAMHGRLPFVCLDRGLACRHKAP